MTRTRRQLSPFTEATEPTVHSAISALLSFSISLPIYSVTNNASFYRSTTSLDRTLPTYCLAEWRPRPPSMELCVVSMELWARHMGRHCVVDKIVTFWGAEFPFFSGTPSPNIDWYIDFKIEEHYCSLLFTGRILVIRSVYCPDWIGEWKLLIK